MLIGILVGILGTLLFLGAAAYYLMYHIVNHDGPSFKDHLIYLLTGRRVKHEDEE